MTKTTPISEAQSLVLQLVEAGLNPREIARRSGHRVSERTIIRWLQGTSVPKQSKNLDSLKRLLGRIKSTKQQAPNH